MNYALSIVLFVMWGPCTIFEPPETKAKTIYLLEHPCISCARVCVICVKFVNLA